MNPHKKRTRAEKRGFLFFQYRKSSRGRFIVLMSTGEYFFVRLRFLMPNNLKISILQNPAMAIITNTIQTKEKNPISIHTTGTSL